LSSGSEDSASDADYSDSDSDSSNSGSEIITPEYLESLLEKARQNAIAAKSIQTQDEEEIITLDDEASKPCVRYYV